MTEHQLRTLVPCEIARRPEPRLVSLPAGPGTVRQRTGPVPKSLDLHEVGWLLSTILEAYDGHRTAAQVRPLVDHALYERLRGTRLPRTRHRAKSVHTCLPADGVIEASARVEVGDRVCALAARFERRKTGWVCLRFHVLDPVGGMKVAA